MLFKLSKPDAEVTKDELSNIFANQISDILATIGSMDDEMLTRFDPKTANALKNLNRESVNMRILENAKGEFVLELT